MELAKSLFKANTRDGYAGRADQLCVESAVDDDEADLSESPTNIRRASSTAAIDYDTEKCNVVEFLASFTPLKSGPFSAIIPSLIPQDFLPRISNIEASETKFDEFGFRISKDLQEFKVTSQPDEPFVEDSQWRLQCIARLNFDGGDEISWENVGNTIPRSEKFAEMVRKGIPHSLRYQLWMRLAGTLKKRDESNISYREIMKIANFDELATSVSIEKDVYRTLPGNACFNSPNSTGVPRLRRVLRGIAFFFNDVGYIQGLGVIVAYLLLFMEEEDAFWTMVAILEDYLPASYYVPSVTGVLADIRVVRHFLTSHLPEVHQSLVTHEIDLNVIMVNWLVPLFGNVVHVRTLLRIWDLLFFYGSAVILRICLGLFKLNEQKLSNAENSVEILNLLSNAPHCISDVEELFEVSFDFTSVYTDEMFYADRQRQTAYLMIDRGMYFGTSKSTNLPKQRLSRRPIRKSKSMIQMILFGDDEDNSQNLKEKNIKQTELMVNLREAILRIAHHFISVDPKLNEVSLVPDYSTESHTKDHENYNIVSENRRRRAKALLDFEKHDDDELGFRKNDIITVISQKDEHCWIGELNGLRGWFPAKLVELLDERSKLYSLAGDDSVSENITDLVRGTLCPTIKQILEHGMKRPSFLGGPCHPWLFIEEAALREVEKDFPSVYSRLILCKTYRLDEDGKVLTPEELLYRCVQSVNQSHDEAHAQMDVKFRSLICLGLNEQVLHLWLEVLCSCVEIVHKWYHPWSFIYSPGWVQIKCELRILSQFPFSLNADWELPQKKEKSQPLKDGVRDMLVKHHLFSWDL